MNLRLLAHCSGFLRASCPVQELLPEQSRLVELRDATEQRPAGTPLSLPKDRFKDVQEGNSFNEHNDRIMQ